MSRGKPKAGDRLFLVGPHRVKYPTVVVSVGRKFFKCKCIFNDDKEGGRDYQFEIETWKLNADCSYLYTLYESEEAYLKNVENQKAQLEFENRLRKIGRLSIEKIKRITEILDETEV